MGTVKWNGDVVALVAQVSTHTVTGVWATNDTATLTCGGRSVTFTVAGVETVTAVVAGLVSAWNLAADATLAEITASDTDPAVTLTKDVAGVPFVTTASEVTAGSGAVGVQVTTTANSSPNDASVALNWDTGVVPGAGDDVVLENSAINILYGLDFSGALLTSFTRRASYTGVIGLPRTHAAGYVEYRDTYLKIDCTLATINASGAGRTKIDFGTVQTACIINGSGTAAETGIPSILLLGTHASNDLTINKGSVGVAFFAGETSTILTASVSYLANQSSDSIVTFGSGTTLGTVTINAGSTLIQNNVTTVTQASGTTTITGTATAGTLTIRGGTVAYRSSGTITAATVASGAVLDFRHDLRGRTVTNLDILAGAAVYDTHATVTWSNPAQLVQCSLNQVTLDLGTNFTWAIA